jgi:hypothetical protein
MTGIATFQKNHGPQGLVRLDAGPENPRVRKARRARPRLRVTPTLIVVAVVIGVWPPSTIASATSGNNTPRLQSKLLNLDQLPSGWVSYGAPANGFGCLAELIEPQGTRLTAIVETGFVASQGLPDVIERLATYRDPVIAYDKIVAHLNACKLLRGYADGELMVGTLKPVALGHYGSASTTFAATFTGDGQRFGDDVVIARQGDVILGIDEGGDFPVNGRQFEAIVSTAAKKLA